MRRLQRLNRALALPVAALVLSSATLPSLATAAMVSTDEVAAGESASYADIQTANENRALVRDFMQRDDVRAEIEAHGVEPAEAQARVDALSDSEIAEIAGMIERDPAGQAVGAIVGAAVLIFVILLITDIVGATDVFPFVRARN